MPAVAASLTARDLLSGRPDRVACTDSVERALDLLVKRGVSSLPVVDGDQLVGIISEWDCLRELSLDGMGHLFERPLPQVAALMNTRLKTVGADAELDTLAQVFVTDRYHRVPVVESDGRLVGMLGRHDVLVALRRERSARHKRGRYPDYRRPA